MKRTIRNLLWVTPFYSLRTFYAIKMLFLGVGTLFFHMRFYGMSPIENLINGPYRIESGLLFLTLSSAGLINIWRKHYLLGLFSAMGDLLVFATLGFDDITHDIWSACSVSYFMDTIANAWLFLKLRFDRWNIGVIH